MVVAIIVVRILVPAGALSRRHSRQRKQRCRESDGCYESASSYCLLPDRYGREELWVDRMTWSRLIESIRHFFYAHFRQQTCQIVALDDTGVSRRPWSSSSPIPPRQCELVAEAVRTRSMTDLRNCRTIATVHSRTTSDLRQDGRHRDRQLGQRQHRPDQRAQVDRCYHVASERSVHWRRLWHHHHRHSQWPLGCGYQQLHRYEPLVQVHAAVAGGRPRRPHSPRRLLAPLACFCRQGFPPCPVFTHALADSCLTGC